MPLGLLQPPVALAHWRTTMPTTTSRSTACHAHPSINPSSEQQPPISIQRRVALLASIAAAAVAPSAYASALGPGLDRAWEAMGGGPADLVFPERFAGIWDVESTLVSVETPLGLEFVPDSRVVARASREDLQRPIRYRMRFTRNAEDAIVPDRQFNTASLMSYYMGGSLEQYSRSITWAVGDPNVLQLDLPDGTSIRTRVTRRSEDALPTQQRIETSEFFEQVFQNPGRPQPRVKASQCFTKYRYRDSADQGTPLIVATQVVSDYLTPYDDAALLVAARGRPVVVYTYRMAFYLPMQ